jgi:DNA polymerase
VNRESPIDILRDLRTFLETHRELFGDEVLVHRRNAVSHAPLSNREGSTSVEETQQESLFVSENRTAVYTADLKDLPTLTELEQTVSECRKCGLCSTRTQTVFGSGDSDADIMFIGEAPGADEDAQGLPFVGRAGQLLTRMIEEPRSLGLPRSQVYIANILKCRPPNNRKPNPDEIDRCEPYLIAQIERIRPRIICALGVTAANTLLKNSLSLGACREKVFDYHGTPLIVTYHPAALLRNPHFKKPAWDDMLRLKRLYQELKKPA